MLGSPATMFELRCAGSLNQSCIPNLDCAWAEPPRASPAAFLLLAAPMAVLILWWLWRDLPLELLAGGGAAHLPAPVALLVLWWLRRDLPRDLLAAGLAAHLPAAPVEQPPRNRALLDPDRTEFAAAAAVRGVLEEEALRPVLLGRNNARGYFRYPEIRVLQAVPDEAPLIDPNSMGEMLWGSPHDVETLRRASIDSDPIGRLSDAIGNPSIFHADPCVVATEPTEMIINLKVVAVLVCLVWRELNEKYQQLSQELKEECFALVAGKSVEKLIEVARSFSEASWCACHVQEVLTILDTLVDVLYNVQNLPLNSSEEAGSISCKIVDALREMLDGTTYEINSREESAIHPVNVVLIQVLEFFHHSRDMMQSLFPTGNPCSDMFNSWESKVEKDTERVHQHEKGKRYIILLNNAYGVWEMMRHPGASFSDVELVTMLICMIQRYRKSYFDECWVPLVVSLMKEDHLKNRRRASLDEFTQGFVSTLQCQMTWKVLPSLKYGLRAEIKNAVVTPYKAFLSAQQANPRRLSEMAYSFNRRLMRGKKNQDVHTVEQLEYKIGQIFES